jgi:signal transduction histidine kinase
MAVVRTADRGPFSEEDGQTLALFASPAAIAIGNARLYENATTQARQLATLNKLTRTLTSSLDPQVVMQRLLEAAQAFLPGAAVRILEWVEGEAILRLVASLGFRGPRAEGDVRLTKGKSLSGIAIATGQPVISSDLMRDPRLLNRAWGRSEGLVAGIALPLLYGERTLGVLGVYLHEAHTFTDEEVELLRAIAAAGAVALSNAQLFAQLRRSQQEHMRLSRRIVVTQEEERHTISRELHDDLGQVLTALRIGLELASQELPADATPLRARLDEAVVLAEAATDRVRRLAHDLRPPALSTLGLDATLEGLCHSVARQTWLRIDYAGVALPGLPDSIAIHLYRCLQEALTNVARHARAHHVQVSLTYDGTAIRLSVEDDGAGFDPEALSHSPRGLGLTGMRERLDLLHGHLALASSPGRGTRLVATVPWRTPA